MGLIQSISKPFDWQVVQENRAHTTVVNQLLDEVVTEFSTLISDIEAGKVSNSVLKKEIEKKIMSQKGIFNPDAIKELLFDTIYGYGLLQKLVDDDSVSDIDIPQFDYILCKRNGHIEKSPSKFENETDFERFCKLLIIRHGGLINEVDNHCRVSDRERHLRINVCIPPRNVNGASLNIRKHSSSLSTLERLMEKGMLNHETLSLLKQINHNRGNYLICGKGAAGKTTLLRALLNDGDEMERVLICESDSELYPQNKNVIVQYIKKNEFGGKTLTLTDLIREGLTMSLDAYCIGEIVGSEAWDFIKAGYTDHRIMGTIHASSAIDALDRLLMLIENETRIDQSKLMQMMVKSVEYIIYLNQFKIHEIIQLKHYSDSLNQVAYESLFKIAGDDR